MQTAHNYFAAALLLTTAMAARPALATETFGNNGIQFDVDTIVDFEFVRSHGAYLGVFGVINLDSGEKTPLLSETKPADNYVQADVFRPSDYKDDSAADTTRDFLGTPGNAVPQPVSEYTFKATQRYTLFLESSYLGKPAGIMYSTNSQNSGGARRALFESGFSGLDNGGSLIRFNDTGSLLVKTTKQDEDFDDFVVIAGGGLACPYTQK